MPSRRGRRVGDFQAIPNVVKRFRALLVADRPHWVYHRKAQIFQTLAASFESDIGFVCPERESEHWTRLLAQNRYDIIWKLGYRMGHDLVNRDNGNLSEFVKAQNKERRAVVATVSNSLVHFPLPADAEGRVANGYRPKVSTLERTLLRSTYAEEMAAGYAQRIPDDIARLSLYNGVSVNNKFAYLRLASAGIPCRLVQDGVNRQVFRCRKPVDQRAFGVLFVSSEKKQAHKGIEIVRELAASLTPLGIRCRALIADSAHNTRTPKAMCRIYNDYPIFLCASRAEGGPATLLEAAACGCVPLSTAVGYTDEIVGAENGFVLPRQPAAFLEKILSLRENPLLLQQMSERVRGAVEAFDWTLRIRHYEQFLLDHLL